MTEQKFLRFPRIITLAYLAVGLGALMQISAGHWDVTFHTLRNIETFFTAPHSILYAGVALSLFLGLYGTALRIKHAFDVKYLKFFQYALIGSGLQIFSGGFDFWWHTNFGFDGLLSPPHAILVAGMILNSLAAVLGVVRMSQLSITPLVRIASLISLTALWMSSIGMVMLFTVPFSEGQIFNFNPHPLLGASTAAIAMPLIGSLVIILAHKTLPVSFPVTTLTAIYVVINGLTMIQANHFISSAMPYYVLAILPAVAVDFILRSRIPTRIKTFLAGMFFAPFFYVLYFPLSTQTFREILGMSVNIQPPVYSTVLFATMYQTVMLWTAIPAILAGLFGAYLAVKVSKKLEQPITR